MWIFGIICLSWGILFGLSEVGMGFSDGFDGVWIMMRWFEIGGCVV